MTFYGEAVTLYRSQLRREGARYEPLARLPLREWSSEDPAVPDRSRVAAMRSGVRWAATIGAAALTMLAAAAPANARLRWSGCGDVEAECAALRVPLDRSGAVPGAVRLRVARYSPPSHRPTLLYLSGGPGGAGVQEFSDVLFEVGGLSKRFDLVSYDQRGTGGSGVLRCRALERDARLRSTAAGEDCAGRLGARRAFYTTRDSVEDIEAVRKELGVEKLTLFGISYGTKLALAYARVHPEHVERIALDSVLEPDDADAFGREPYQAMASTLAALCPDRCRGVTADPAGDLARLADRLRAAPLHGTTYGPGGRRHAGTLTALALSDLMFDSDYNPAIRAGIPVGVRAALDRGDAAPLLRLADAAAQLSRVPPARVFSAARYATVCEETPLPWPRGAPFGERAQRARDQAAALGRERSSRSPTRRRRPTRSTSACTGRRRPRRRSSAARIRRSRRSCSRAARTCAPRRRARRGWRPRWGRSGSSCRGSGTRSWAGIPRAAGSGGCSRSCAGGRLLRPARAWRPRCPPPACRRPR